MQTQKIDRDRPQWTVPDKNDWTKPYYCANVTSTVAVVSAPPNRYSV